MSWISIENQKPEIDEFVFVMLQDEFPDVLKFVGDSFVTYDGLEEEDVTHWMSIPKLSV